MTSPPGPRVHTVGVARDGTWKDGTQLWLPYCVDCSRGRSDWVTRCDLIPAWADPLLHRGVMLIVVRR